MFTAKLTALRLASFAALGITFAALPGCGVEEQDPVAETVQGISLPATLCVTAHSHKNSGTTNSIYVKYVSINGAVECTLANGVGTGSTACCGAIPTTATDAEYFAIQTIGFILGYTNSNNANDGLRYSNITATGNGINFSIGTYTAILLSNPDSVCDGCVAGTFCNSCWIDSDAHNNCSKAAISSTMPFLPGSNYVGCI